MKITKTENGYEVAITKEICEGRSYRLFRRKKDSYSFSVESVEVVSIFPYSDLNDDENNHFTTFVRSVTDEELIRYKHRLEQPWLSYRLVDEEELVIVPLSWFVNSLI